MKKHYVIIPAAGLATRLRPISNAMSKAMVPVAGKPILAHILSALDESKEVTDVVVVTGENNDIERFLEHKTYNNIKLHCTKQVNPKTYRQSTKGPLEAVWSALRYIAKTDTEDDSLLTVWLGDTLMVKQHEINGMLKMTQKPWAAVSHVKDWTRWCLAEYDDIHKLVLHDKPKERPVGSNSLNALIGIYHLGNWITAGKAVIDGIGAQYESDQYELAPMLLSYKDIGLPEVTGWVDAGDLPSLHEANAKLINNKARAFNTVLIDGQSVAKYTSNAEVNWYLDVWNKFPDARRIVPAVYKTDLKENLIIMESCSGTTLQDMLVYDNIREECWDFIIKRVISEYAGSFCNVPPVGHELDMDITPMFHDNILARLNSLIGSDFITGSQINIIKTAHGRLYKQLWYSKSTREYNVPCIHGDFHFGNIIYDATVNKVKTIDPRGKWNGVNTTSGNIIYDMAKLYQSVYAEYAWIEAGEPVNHQSKKVVLRAIDKHIGIIMGRTEDGDKRIEQIKQLSVILLASAIPLHSDSPARQARMTETVLRLLQ